MRKSVNRQKETKFLPIIHSKVKDEDQGIVEELVSVYGNIDHGRDILHNNMFAKSISENAGGILVLDQHNTDSIFRSLGKPLSLKEVGRSELPAEVQVKFPDATGGLIVETQYNLETPEGKGAFSRIKNGEIKQRSIGFEALDIDHETIHAVKTDTGYERRDKKDKDAKPLNVRHIRTGKLMEYSPVLWGMNEATATISAKDADQTPADRKEMTEDGPVRRMGDVMIANMHQFCAMVAGDWLASGYMSREEHKGVIMALDSALESFEGLMPAEVMGRCPDHPADELPWYMFSRVGNQGIVTSSMTPPTEIQPSPLPPADKAGRVLSRENEQELRAALASIEAVLSKIAVEESQDESKAAPPAPTPPVESVSPFRAGPEPVTAGLPPTQLDTKEIVRQRLSNLKRLEAYHATPG